MMKLGGIILAVGALVALTGCSTSTSEPPTAETSAPVSASASPAAEVAAEPSVNPDEGTEKRFVEFALMRADVHSVSKKPSPKAITAALHSFCEDGKTFKITSSSAYNKNMDMIAETAYCEHLAK
ncbi:hypothetical protein CGQ24_07420 [Arthrobacter sp. 7749]|nr:hypothetical protein CGQ24_07420 [Arthrobacter sp. 7749]